MDNSNSSILSSCSCMDLYGYITDIAYSCICGIKMTEFKMQLKEEIDVKLSDLNLILPWYDKDKIKKYPYAKLMYNLSLPITELKYLYKNIGNFNIPNKFRELIWEYDDYDGEHYNDFRDDNYYCEEPQHCKELNMLISKEYPGYSIELSDENEHRYKTHFIKLVNNIE